ncbi:glycoside hydrolase family 65 protein [Rufibacter glacialis]|uniref:Glycoside hydrolase family 65 protein n=1 Tax=Rufibacter glacialis TaxID=1259555 RepID=A0A5M8QA65_9BACT|nr:glycoside hydrolase family 65 protein [Rufibacter glacialis]KAA6431726.1 glycoside hydrolase family 65 protein [Rufibacter glacialis]GGK82114.1 maltose phosphorylase [Rufibacter glacialis]
MKQFLTIDEWSIIEEGFQPEYNQISESVFSLGNGRMGQRANFEEAYSGETLQGNYVAGVYYPDKTRVGWWKNGYPEYFAKVLNATNWIGIDVKLAGETLDLHQCQVAGFRRELNMREGWLSRQFTATLPSGKQVRVEAKRFTSIVDDEVGAIRYSITPFNFSGTLTLTPYLDADVKNADSNYDEKFWNEVVQEAQDTEAYVVAETKKTFFHVCTGQKVILTQGGQEITPKATPLTRSKYVSTTLEIPAQEGQETVLYKYAANLSSENHPKQDLLANTKAVVAAAAAKGFEQLLQEQAAAWAAKWEESDIVIEGDATAQQGIRFNIFQLNQTYTGEDERLNIGPKGFTGEKYGGTTYWDTEAYCLPFYLATADPQIARNLLVYRYKHLPKAIENAEKLGFTGGAALYPMVTMNGEECHNEWEITFEEIHRNGAIAHAIHDYIRYTGDDRYLAEYGLEVLVGISRFWAQRVNWSGARKQYVMLGVTGPNEYENNVNNNWYTSTIATWTLDYTLKALQHVQEADAARYQELVQKMNLDVATETEKWQHVIDHMYYPEDPELGIFLQQDGFLDKEQTLVKDLPAEDRPLNQKWSWDRILRSVFIKQADVLQGIYLFEDRYDLDTIRRNYDFYEPRTVHESSLSPCVHSILAAKLGDEERAYEFYLRTARLDLDDYNNDTEDGCHITSMAGTWMSVVQGFGGMRVRDNQLHFNPFIPAGWSSYSFKIRFRGHLLNIKVTKEAVLIENQAPHALTLQVFGQSQTIGSNAKGEFSHQLV